MGEFRPRPDPDMTVSVRHGLAWLWWSLAAASLLTIVGSGIAVASVPEPSGSTTAESQPTTEPTPTDAPRPTDAPATSTPGSTSPGTSSPETSPPTTEVPATDVDIDLTSLCTSVPRLRRRNSVVPGGQQQRSSGRDHPPEHRHRRVDEWHGSTRCVDLGRPGGVTVRTRPKSSSRGKSSRQRRPAIWRPRRCAGMRSVTRRMGRPRSPGPSATRTVLPKCQRLPRRGVQPKSERTARSINRHRRDRRSGSGPADHRDRHRPARRWEHDGTL